MSHFKSGQAKKYKAIIFDVGDTLLKHYPDQTQIYAERMEALGFSVDAVASDEINLALEQASIEQIAKEENGAPRMSDEDFEAMLDSAALKCVFAGQDDSVYLEKLSRIPFPKQELKIIPGVFETLTVLKEMGFRLAVVSNHRTWLPDYLAQIGLEDFFEAIIVSDIVGFEKPDIRIMQIALDKLSLAASECLYVGDHPFDVLCAKNSGMDCAWIAAPNRVLPDSILFKEDFRLNELRDLLSVVKVCADN